MSKRVKARMRVMALIVAAAAALGLAGCVSTGDGVSDTSGDATSIRYVEVQTPRGAVPCLVFSSYKKGGLDCDWEATR